jgi:hypothetical protein
MTPKKMDNKHMKIYGTLVAIKEMQIKNRGI